MPVQEYIISWNGEDAKVNCDGMCAKAWGMRVREAAWNGDILEYLADNELGGASVSPDNFGCGSNKPLNLTEFPNKWCLRECERCNIGKLGEEGEPLEVKDFSTRNPIASEKILENVPPHAAAAMAAAGSNGNGNGVK